MVVVATTVVVVVLVVDVVLVVVVCGTVTTVTCTTVVGGRTVVVATWLTEGAVVACTGCKVVVGGKPTNTDVSGGIRVVVGDKSTTSGTIVVFAWVVVDATTDGAGMVGQGLVSTTVVEKMAALLPTRKAAAATAVVMRVGLVIEHSIQSSTGEFLHRRAMRFRVAGVHGTWCRIGIRSGLSFRPACS